MAADYRALDLPHQLRNWRKCGLRLVFGAPACQEAAPVQQGTARWEEEFRPPEPWLGVWNSISRLPCPLLWTYQELGPDLLSPGQTQRQELFAKICRHMEVPADCIVFWPLSEHARQGTKARLDIFWQGVRLIKPRYLLVFGQQAMHVLYPDLAGQYGLYTQPRPNVLYLPGPQDMLPDNRQAKAFVWKMLQQIQKQVFPG
ncbi:MAG: hypothetical protein ACLFRL_00395 [Desulfohalobiaceae bacterium]